jgi:hypothetical protein
MIFINNRKSSNIFFCVIFALCFLMLILSIEKTVPKRKIWIEAELAENINEPLQVIDDEEAFLGKAVVSTGISHSVLGFASYPVNLAQSGKYQFWGRCFWPAGCSNSFLVQVDNSKKFLLGNNLPLKTWHWVKGPNWQLNNGKHNIFLWNEEQDSRLDRILLTLDKSYIPRGLGDRYDLSIDFENISDLSFLNPNDIDFWKVRKANDQILDPIYCYLDKVRVNFVTLNTRKTSLYYESLDTQKDSLSFYLEDIKNPEKLIATIQNPSNMFLKNFRNPILIEQLSFHNDPRIYSKILLNSIVDEFNHLLALRSLYKRIGIRRDNPIIRKIKNAKNVNELRHLNKQFLLQSFPEELGRNQAYYMSPIPDKKIEYSLITVSCPSIFVFACNIKLGKNHPTAKLLFNYQNEREFYSIDFSTTNLMVARVGDKGIKEMADIDHQNCYKRNTFNHISLIRYGSDIAISLNGKTMISIQDSTYLGGAIGVASESGDVYFDDIEYITNLEPILEENFFETFKFGYLLKDWLPLEGQWCSPRKERSLVGKRISDKPALVVLGKEYWKDYSVKVALKNADYGSNGVCFCYQDTNNYYLFRWIAENKRHRLQLLKKQEGKLTVLAESKKIFYPGYWYMMGIKKMGAFTYALIDNNLIFKIEDPSFTYGKIGLWTNSEKEVNFGHILIEPTTFINSLPEKDFIYTFNTREQAALDYCDWMPQKNKNGIDYLGDDKLVWRKGLFDNKLMINKKVFSQDFTFETEISLISFEKENYIDFFIYSYIDESHITYNFKINRNAVELLINNRLVDQKRISGTLNQFSISRKNYQLQFLINGHLVLRYKDNRELSGVKFGIGIYGITPAEIKLKRIAINAEEILEKTMSERVFDYIGLK